MEASPVRAIQYFDGTKQNVVPLFQRPYSWTQEHWDDLWADILEQYESEHLDSTHFMGAIVSVPARAVPVGVSKYLIVDGQQRLTTLALILCTLRNYVGEKENGQIEDYLINRFQDGTDRFKLLPTQSDRSVYIDLVLKKIMPGESHEMGCAVRHFDRCIAGVSNDGEPLDPNRVLQVIQHCLQVVMINLGETDDPYLIFESLNHKGKPLTQADLIRNYLLMRFPQGVEQDNAYLEIWEPMERRLGPSLPDFFRHFAMKTGDKVRTGSIYTSIKSTLSAVPDPEIFKAAKEIHRYSLFYSYFLNPTSHPSPAIAQRLQALIDIESTTSYPLLLRLFDSADRNIITLEQLSHALQSIESFIVRRALCGVPTNALNKLFLQLAKNFREDSCDDWLDHSLASGGGGRKWPSDEDVASAILQRPQYGERATKYVLLTIERSYGSKEPIDLEHAVLTIEHIMPQTLNRDWKASLGDNWKAIYEEFVDTLGNLTLTGYNQELGNVAFDLKKGKLATSHLELNRWVVDQPIWNGETITKRARVLTDKIIKLWPKPSDNGLEI